MSDPDFIEHRVREIERFEARARRDTAFPQAFRNYGPATAADVASN